MPKQVNILTFFLIFDTFQLQLVDLEKLEISQYKFVVYWTFSSFCKELLQHNAIDIKILQSNAMVLVQTRKYKFQTR